MNFTDRFINGLLSFFLSAILIVLLIVAAISTSIFNQNTVINKFTSVSYCQNVFENILQKADGISIPSGVDKSIIEDVITFEKVQKDAFTYITKAFDGVNYDFNDAQMRSQIVKNITYKYNLQGIEITQELSDSINIFAEQIINIYTDTISLDYLHVFVKASNMFNKYKFVVYGVSAVFAAINFTMLFVFNKYKHRALRQIAIGFSTASLFGILMSIFGAFTPFYKNLNFAPYYFNDISAAFISKFFVVSLTYSFMFFALNLAIYVLIWKTRRIAKIK